MIELFRFIEQSFVDAAKKEESIDVEDDTPFQNQLRSERGQPDAAEAMKNEAAQFIDAQQSGPQDAVSLGSGLLEFHQRIQQLVDEDVPHGMADNVAEIIETIFDQSPGDLVQSESFTADKHYLNDILVAVKLSTGFDKTDAAALVAMRQALALVEDAAGSALPVSTVAELKSRLLRPIRVPQGLFPPKAAVPEPPPQPSLDDQQQIGALQEEAAQLKNAYQSLLSIHPDDLEVVPAHTADMEAPAQGVRSAHLVAPADRAVLAISAQGLDRLNNAVKTTIENAGLDITSASLVKMTAQVRDRWIDTTRALLPLITPARLSIYQLGIHTFAVQPPTQTKILAAPAPDFSHAVTRPVGIGNLQVVRQELIGYEAGEVSHIENVLEGELYQRTTNRSESTEVTVATEMETVRSEERDLQTTDRNELATETQKEASRQTVATQGQTATTDYGKLVENSKTNYARSVTDRAVNNLTQKVQEQRVTREKKFFGEKTKHEFDNRKGDSRVRGIYQWVDKKYKTRVLNYGKRLLYDVVIPEPAAFLIESLKNAPQPEPFQVTKPNEPWFGPQDLDAANYMYYARLYGVTGAVEPPPEDYIETFAKTDSLEVSKVINAFGGTIHACYFTAFNIKIPQGYKAVSGYVQRVNHRWINSNPDRLFEFYIGENTFLRFGAGDIAFLNKSFKLNGETGDLPVTLRSFESIVQFNYAVGINCQRTGSLLERWQLKTFATINEGYRRQKAEYEDKLAQRQTLIRTQMMLAQNYSRNPAVEQTELKKAFIHLLVSEHFAQVAFPTPQPGQLPTDPVYMKKWGAVVAFFERAFEWDNIVYFYYPYFWGRPARWGELVLIQDLDPQFEEFLKAGAARVVVPVRPGFEGALAHYHETGDVWMGEEIPDMFSDQYVAIIDEIKSRNFAPGEEVCVAEWEVKLPTTLVILKDDAKLPEWQSQANCQPPDNQ